MLYTCPLSHITPNANMPTSNGHITCPFALEMPPAEPSKRKDTRRLDRRRIESYRTAATQLQCPSGDSSYIGATSRGPRSAAAAATAAAPVRRRFGRRAWRGLVPLTTSTVIPPASLGLVPLLI